MTRKECKAGKQERIQKLLKGLANIRPEPVKVGTLGDRVISSTPREQLEQALERGTRIVRFAAPSVRPDQSRGLGSEGSGA